MKAPDTYLNKLLAGDFQALARCISLVENRVEGYDDLLQSLPVSDTPVIGITGPPGAGKSTLVDALIGHYVSLGKKVAVICVDPSSAFNRGALLGDRIRMSEWYTNPQVYIRSLASRGALGGLHPGIIEITDLVKAAGFDYVIVETVGIGQSEIEIIGLADVTTVVVVPEAGDEIQTMKAGMMEIADVFVVNKADRPGADAFINNLKKMWAPAFHHNKHTIEIVKTVASEKKGTDLLAKAIEQRLLTNETSDKKYYLLAEKSYYLIRERRMDDIQKSGLLTQLKAAGRVNLYRFLKDNYQL